MEHVENPRTIDANYPEPKLKRIGWCQVCAEDIHEGEPHFEDFNGDIWCKDCMTPKNF